MKVTLNTIFCSSLLVFLLVYLLLLLETIYPTVLTNFPHLTQTPSNDDGPEGGGGWGGVKAWPLVEELLFCGLL